MAESRPVSGARKAKIRMWVIAYEENHRDYKATGREWFARLAAGAKATLLHELGATPEELREAGAEAGTLDLLTGGAA